MKRFGAACVVLLVAIFIAAAHVRHDADVWTPDGAIYLRLTLQDRGMSADTARRAANRFVIQTFDRNPTHDASDRGLYVESAPQYYVEQFALFANRPLYPLIAAVFEPAFGPAALALVSAAAYVMSVGVMFTVLLQLTTPLRATLGALVFATQSLVLSFAALPLTDELALFFWTAALGAIVAYERRASGSALAAFGLAALALTLTRPAFFLTLGAAAGAYDVMRRSFRPAVAAAPLTLAVLAGAVYFVYTASVHGPSVVAQLQWQYAEQRSFHGVGAGRGPIVWYMTALLVDVYAIVVSAVGQLGGIVIVFLALLGARDHATNGVARTVLYCAAAISVAMFVNPIGAERPVLLPLAPLVVFLAVIGLERFRLRANAGLNSA